MEKLLVDTDVLVEYLRGAAEAKAFLESQTRRLATSVICVAELVAGARNARERGAIERFLLAFDLLPVDADVARLAGEYRRKYLHSHGAHITDALIAATATTRGLALATFNVRRYPMLAEVVVPYARAVSEA